MPSPCRFPPPWSIEEQEACFIVRDANGQALAYPYFKEEPGQRAAAKVLTRDEGIGSQDHHEPTAPAIAVR
jgi:hypothetical protein